jgi:hypothetical protein
MEDIQKIKEFFSKPLEEAKTDINKIKKRLDALGIKYEMSATDKVRPFKVIYKPVDKSDEFYDKFEDIVDLFNLKSFVKSSMNEAKSLTGGYPYKKTSGRDFERIDIAEPMDNATRNKMIKNFRAAGWDAKPSNRGGIVAIKRAIMEAQEEDRYKRPIVTNKQGEKFILQGFSTSGYYLIPYDGSKYWEPSSVSKNKWIPEKSINWDDYNFTKQQFEKLKASHGESEKEINKKFQDMNEAKEEDVVDTITMDVPLFIRILEYSREDAAEDMDLHDVTEKAIALNKEKSILSMDDYDAIVGGAEEIQENKIKELAEAVFAKLKK